MDDIRLITPYDVIDGGDAGSFPVGNYSLRFLAQGDSWFSIGAVPPFLTSNLFDKMSLSKDAVAVNCAKPGAELRHMTDSTSNQVFLQLLSGKQARPWTALLLSGLGNDVISASQSGPENPPDKRLLATKAEWGAGADPSRYLSPLGWETFSQHAEQVFEILLQKRDKSEVNRGIPIVMHTYDIATPRNSGAGLRHGPYLFKAVRAFGVPEPDWVGLSGALQGQMRELILSMARKHPTIRVVDTQGCLTPASTKDRGPTVHWQNEIHPTRTGYRLLGNLWERALEKWFCTK